MAGPEAFNWLRNQSMVKPEAMGITGTSWGGYSTTLLAGLLGSKVKAAYLVYGSGYYDRASFWKEFIAGLSSSNRTAWLAAFDAGRRAGGIKAAYFLEGASNDTFFWPEALAATLSAIPGARNHAWGPNLDHARMPSAPAMQRLWFDHHLMGTEKAFPIITVLRSEAAGGGALRLFLQVSATTGLTVDSVRVFHSIQDPGWTKRSWLPAHAIAGADSEFSVLLPAPPVGKTWDYFAQSWDNRGVATAGALLNSGSPVVGLVITAGHANPFTPVNTPVRADGRRFSTSHRKESPQTLQTAPRLQQ